MPVKRTFALPAGLRVADAAYGRAVYLVGGRAKLIDLVRGRTRDLGAATHVNLDTLSAIVANGRTVTAFRVG